MNYLRASVAIGGVFFIACALVLLILLYLQLMFGVLAHFRQADFLVELFKFLVGVLSFAHFCVTGWLSIKYARKPSQRTGCLVFALYLIAAIGFFLLNLMK